MTRINLVNPVDLTDQHLIAEYREISRLPKFLKKSIASSKGNLKIPSEYIFGTGHVTFFYDKLGFIKNRHDSLKIEGAKRGFNLDAITISLEDIDAIYCNDFAPSAKDISRSKSRILEKLMMKPSWYKYYKAPLPHDFSSKYIP